MLKKPTPVYIPHPPIVDEWLNVMLKPPNAEEFRIVNRHWKSLLLIQLSLKLSSHFAAPTSILWVTVLHAFICTIYSARLNVLWGEWLCSLFGFAALLWCAYSSQLNYKALIWSAVGPGAFSLQGDLSNIMSCVSSETPSASTAQSLLVLKGQETQNS